MESILTKIHNSYSQMGRSEKKIADWITANFQDILPLSISQLAEECDCGEATIVRFSRRLGLQGYQALKLKIAQESTGSATGGLVGVEKEDSCYQIFEKRINDISVALDNTRFVLDANDLENAAKMIIGARRIVIFGLGSSSSVAADAQHKFMRAGLDAIAYSDNHMQAIAATHLSKEDVAIGISHSGASTDVVDALKTAKQSGAKTIAVTNYGNSPITSVSDIVLFTKSEETKYSILAMSSRIAQLTIFDAIYTYIVLNSSKRAIKAIKATETALEDKKYK